MAPMPYKEKKKEPTDQEIRASKKAVCKIVKTTSVINSLIERVTKGTLNPSVLNEYFGVRPLLQAAVWGEKNLIKDLLTAGADPNWHKGDYVPLDVVEQLKNIETLLQFKANPKLCRKWPIINSLYYYIKRKSKEKEPRGYYSSRDERWQNYYKKVDQEKKRLADKALQCIKLLLQAGANIKEAGDLRPLKVVMDLTEKSYLSLERAKEIAKVLISYGADPADSSIDFRRYRQYSSEKYLFRLAKYMYQERRKYQAIRQLLIGHNDRNSLLSTLPKDIWKEIGLLVKHGGPVPPARPLAEPVTIKEVQSTNDAKDDIASKIVENNSLKDVADAPEKVSEATVKDLPDQNAASQSASMSSDFVDQVPDVNTEKNNEKVDILLPKKLVPKVSRCAFLRGKGIFILAVIAAVGIGKWAYNKWRDRDKEDEEELEYYNEVLAL
jgi:hypothetical protein